MPCSACILKIPDPSSCLSDFKRLAVRGVSNVSERDLSEFGDRIIALNPNLIWFGLDSEVILASTTEGCRIFGKDLNVPRERRADREGKHAR